MKYFVLVIGFFGFPFLLFSQDRGSDSLALVSLYNDLGGPDWSLGENWLTDAPLEEWQGIRIRNDRVVDVELKSFDVNGVFPNSILDITSLETFEVRNGTITGGLPTGLAQLEKLDRFIMQNCGLTGSIPDDFGLYPAMGTYILDRNSLSGPLPALLPETIFNIDLSLNQFTGALPETWANHGLNTFNLDHNVLTGDFDIFETMPNLAHIDLSDNDWDEGGFPEWLDDIPLLDWFACENCNMVGELPSSLDFSNTPNHSRVIINDNDLSGDISLLFAGQESANGVFLRAQNNNFSGEFPAHKIYNADQIDIRGNAYTSISDFDNVIEVDRFDLRFNDFNFSSLEPIIEFIQLDSIVGVLYDNQNPLFGVDTVVVNELTEITIEAGDDYPGTNYEWFDNFGLLESETESTITLVVNENTSDNRYRSKMTHPDFPDLELVRSYFYVEVDISTSVIEAEDQITTVYPNPATDYIRVENFESVESYQIANLNGRILVSSKMSNNGFIDVAHLQSGIYLLMMQTENGIESQKLIKQ